MTDQQIDEFLELLAKSPTSARDMVRGLFAAHEAKAAPAVPGGNDPAWTLAAKVREALDRKACPGYYMDVAVEAVVHNYAPSAPSQPVNRPQNCGTSFCSCIECVCELEPEPVTLTDEMVEAGGRALCDIAADSCNVDREDNWNMHGEVYKSDAKACIIAALREKEQAE